MYGEMPIFLTGWEYYPAVLKNVVKKFFFGYHRANLLILKLFSVYAAFTVLVKEVSQSNSSIFLSFKSKGDT